MASDSPDEDISHNHLERINRGAIWIASHNKVSADQHAVLTASPCGYPIDMVLVSVATYNEIDNLPRLVDGVLEYLPDADLLIIDDNSPDGTGQWCDRRAEEDRRVRCMHRPGKQGLGSATLAGLQYAIDHDYFYVITMDADLSHNPVYLPKLVAGMDPTDGHPVDVMIGSRYVAGGGVAGWPLRRRIMSRVVNWYARCMLGLTTSDNSGAFRCYRTETLRRLDFNQMQSQGYSVFEEILFRLQQTGACFAEFPIVFVDREKGKSKINRQEAWTALRILSRIGWERLWGSRKSG